LASGKTLKVCVFLWIAIHSTASIGFAKKSLKSFRKRSVGQNISTLEMEDEEVAEFDRLLKKYAFASRAHFFRLAVDGLIALDKAAQLFDWPPRFLTKKEAFVLNGVLPFFGRKEILFLKKLLLSTFKQKSSSKPRKETNSINRSQ
jgi:hypothetical protein